MPLVTVAFLHRIADECSMLKENRLNINEELNILL